MTALIIIVAVLILCICCIAYIEFNRKVEYQWKSDKHVVRITINKIIPNKVELFYGDCTVWYHVDKVTKKVTRRCSLSDEIDLSQAWHARKRNDLINEASTCNERIKVAMADNDITQIPKWILRKAVSAMQLDYNTIKDDCCMKRQLASSINYLQLYLDNKEVSDEMLANVARNYVSGAIKSDK